MGEYLLSIATLAIALDILEILAAEKFKALTRAAVSIILVTAIITPLPSLLGQLKGELDFSFEDQVSGEDIRLSAFEEGIARYIATEFDLDRSDVSVEAIGFSAEEMKAERILVTLSGLAVTANYKKIEKTLNQLELGVAEVKIEI